MLTRNCALNNLLHEGDFNVRVTVYDPTKASKDSEKQKSAWFEAIRDSIGGRIVNSSSVYVMQIHDENGCKVERAIVWGKHIVHFIQITYNAPQALRITLKPARSVPNDSAKVWIIV